MKKSPTKKTLQDIADKLWATIVKERDQECIICHTRERLNAHHIFTKGAHGNMRYNTANGVTLCASHHIFGVHLDAASYLPAILQYVGETVFRKLQKKSKAKSKPIRIDDLADIITDLERELNILRGRK